MSTSDRKKASRDATKGLQEPSEDAEPPNSIWTTELQPGQIRLFNIDLDDSDDISGALEVFEHKSAPKYIAQSYVCGEGESDFRITVNGNPHRIKPNLSIALRQTKRVLQGDWSSEIYGPSKYTTWLWIDAVCIHQRNVTELQMQIKFMEHIYRVATATFVSFGNFSRSQELIGRFLLWCGNEEELSRLQEAVECLSDEEDEARIINADISSRKQSQEKLQTDFSISKEDFETIRDAFIYNNVSSSSIALSFVHPFWQACFEMFEADWFLRVWTYQELVLSKHLFATLPMCVPWSALQILFEILRGTNSVANDDHPGTEDEEQRRLNFSYKFNMHFLLFSEPQTSLEIRDLFIATAQRRTTFPKDHVFAMHGLMDDETQNLIRVDYTKTDAHVFLELLKLALKTSTAAQLLPVLWEDFAFIPIITPGLPSWGLDLSNETAAPIGGSNYFKTLSKDVLAAFLEHAQLRVSPEDRPIFLTVLELDVVSMSDDQACPHLGQRGILRPGHMAYAPAWTDFVLSTDNVFSADDEVLLWIRSLCDNLTSSVNDLPTIMVYLSHFIGKIASTREDPVSSIIFTVFLVVAAQLLKEGLTLGEVVRHVRQGHDLVHGIPPHIFQELDADPGHAALAYELKRAALRLASNFGGAHVFTTVGARFGYSPKPVSPGDKICIAPGGTLLHIFSTAPSRYITCASIDGLMDDSLPDFVRELDRDWEEITIH